MKQQNRLLKTAIFIHENLWSRDGDYVKAIDLG